MIGRSITWLKTSDVASKYTVFVLETNPVDVSQRSRITEIKQR